MEYHRLQSNEGNLEDTSTSAVRFMSAMGEGDFDEDVMDEEYCYPLRSDHNPNTSNTLNTTMSTCEEHLMDHDHVSTVNVNAPHPRGKPTAYLFVAAAMAALGGVLFGYDIGIMSGALLQLKKEFSLSCFQQELVVSSLLIGATIGSILGGFVIDWIGRRWAIIMNSLVFIIGAIILTASTSYPVLIVGRLIVGFAVSLSAIGECIYISEISPKERRGQLVSINELGITLGLLLAYLVNFFFIRVISGWRYMFALSAIPALCQGVGMFLLPPSPRFLVQRKQNQRAKKVLMKLRGSDQVSEELTAIQNSVSLERSYTLLNLFQSVDNMRWRMGVGAALVFFQQITGQTNVVYYAPTVLENLGFEDNVSATVASVGVGIVKVIATCTCLMLVDKFGRRCFLLCGSILMAIFIIILGIITQRIPTTSIKDTCQATSLPAEDTSLNLTLSMRHRRNSDQIFGEEVGSQYQLSIEGPAQITDRTLEPFQMLEHERNFVSLGSEYAVQNRRDISLNVKKTISESDGMDTSVFRTKGMDSGKQRPLEFISPHDPNVMPLKANNVLFMNGNAIRQRRNVQPSTVQSSGSFYVHSSNKPLSKTELSTQEGQSIVSSESLHSGRDVTTASSAMPDEAQARSEDHIPSSAKWSALVFLLLYVGAYSFGFGPISWLVISEIFPAGVRGRASSLTTVFNWGTNVIISLTFLDVIRKFGISWTFLIYGLVCSVAAVFIYFTIPETKNRSLEQISEELSHKSSVGESCAVKCLSCDWCCVRSSRRYRPTLLITDDTTL